MLSDLYLSSSSDRESLRIGLLLDAINLPRWVSRVIDDISECNFAAIELVVLRHQPSPASERASTALPLRAWRLVTSPRHRRGVLYWRYSQLDARRRALAPDPFETVDCSGLLQGVPCLQVTPISRGFTHYFPPAAIEDLRARNLDVILRFGFNILRGEILEVARYGIWSFHHGDNDYYRGGPAHFWELVEGNPLSGVMLQVLTEDLDDGHVLCKLLFSTEPGLSVQRNRWGPYWGSTHLVIRKLHELHQYGWDHVRNNLVPHAPYRGRRKIYRAPTNTKMVRWLAPKIISKCLTAPFGKSSLMHWRIGLRASGHSVYASAGQGLSQVDLQGFCWLDAPRGHSWADPFLIEHDGSTWLFFEDFGYLEKRGVISVAQLGKDCTLTGVRVCLSRPYHLSFPNVFRHDGEFFMIPETFESGNVELYRAVNFPYEWTLEKVLFRAAAVDTCSWFDGRQWWFFVGMGEPEGHVAVSMLLSAESLTGAWRAHPANPIACDARTARNAGAIFSSHGKLFRPSQDCAGAYGRSVSLQEIVTLTSEQYVERSALTILPRSSWNFSGLHTYNFCGPFEAIDVRRQEAVATHQGRLQGLPTRCMRGTLGRQGA